MTRREFPALGFDPAPGEPAELSGAQHAAAASAATYAGAADTLTRLDSADWTGQAADGFRSQLANLPGNLDRAATAHRETAAALGDYADTLTALQRRADDLERQAADLSARQSAAVAEVNRIAAERAPANSADLAHLQENYRSARATANSYAEQLDDVLTQELHGPGGATRR